MKNYFRIALCYATAALGMGVFYREFTKANGFTGLTVLSKTHLHLFALGTLVMILIAIISNHLELKKSKAFKIGFPIYNVGLILMTIMFTVRGVMQVKGIDNKAISGLAGASHIIFAAGILFILHAFVFLAVNKKKESKKK